MPSTGLEIGNKPAVRSAGFVAPVPVDPRDRMLDALRRAEGSITAASARLGVHRTTLWRWMKRCGLHRADYRA